MRRPSSVRLSPVSIIVAYTTATEVVESEIPAIHDAWTSQWATYRANTIASRNGARKLANPIASAGLRWRLSESGSISAPARNVSNPAPNVARKSIQAVVWM